jgi:hypothetical protein
MKRDCAGAAIVPNDPGAHALMSRVVGCARDCAAVHRQEQLRTIKGATRQGDALGPRECQRKPSPEGPPRMVDCLAPSGHALRGRLGSSRTARRSRGRRPRLTCRCLFGAHDAQLRNIKTGASAHPERCRRGWHGAPSCAVAESKSLARTRRDWGRVGRLAMGQQEGQQPVKIAVGNLVNQVCRHRRERRRRAFLD